MPSKLNDYEIMNVIGSGSYGKCVKIKRKADDKVFVWKDMDYGSMTEGEKQQLVSEVNLLRELKHQYIVRYHDRVIDRSKSRLYLIMEFCSGGDLASLISKCRRQLTYLDEEFILKILAQLGLALQACHNQRQKSGNQGKILHRDLKPANVFLDENKDVKLGDFGLARVLNHDTSFAKTFVGTPYYMSPEQMSKSFYNEKSDIWSLGCLMYEMCALVPPFTALNQKNLAEKIKLGQFKRIPSKYSDCLQDCISSMLRLNPLTRPSLQEIFDLSLLKDPVKLYKQLSASYSNKNKDLKQKKNEVLIPKNDIRKTTADIFADKERELKEWEKKLEIKEADLRKKESALEERERIVNSKMKSADALVRQMKINDSRKQVHFADGKENKMERVVTSNKLVSDGRVPLSRMVYHRRALGMR